MARRKFTSKERRKQARAQKRQGFVAFIPFDRDNGAGTTPYVIQCERCGRRHEGGEKSWLKDRPCLCGYEYARIVV